MTRDEDVVILQGPPPEGEVLEIWQEDTLTGEERLVERIVTLLDAQGRPIAADARPLVVDR